MKRFNTLWNYRRKIISVRISTDSRPGQRSYFDFVKALMPLEIPLGTVWGKQEEVYWLPGKESNGFLLILGASGSGKTEALKKVGKCIAEQGIPIFVLDYHGDVSFPGVNSALISSGTFSSVGINPMELDSNDAGNVGLFDQQSILLELIQRAVPALGHRQRALLRRIFQLAYHENGIHDGAPWTWCYKPPSFSTVLQLLYRECESGSAEERRLSYGCIDAISDVFTHPVFHRESFLTADDIQFGNIRVDLSKINSDGIRHIVSEVLLRKIFNVMRLRGPIPVNPSDDSERFRIFVIIDEAKILSLVGGDVNDSSRILNLMATEGRKYGIGLVLASQMSDHFGHEIKANTSSWLVLKPMDDREAKRNAPNAYVSPGQLLLLGGRGDGYFRTGAMSEARHILVNKIHESS